MTADSAAKDRKITWNVAESRIRSHQDHHTLARDIAIAMLDSLSPPLCSYRGRVATLGTRFLFQPIHLVPIECVVMCAPDSVRSQEAQHSSPARLYAGTHSKIRWWLFPGSSPPPSRFPLPFTLGSAALCPPLLVRSIVSPVRSGCIGSDGGDKAPPALGQARWRRGTGGGGHTAVGGRSWSTVEGGYVGFVGDDVNVVGVVGSIRFVDSSGRRKVFLLR